MNRAELEVLDRTSLVELALRQAERIAELETRLAEIKRRFAGSPVRRCVSLTNRSTEVCGQTVTAAITNEAAEKT
jgi:hypothetical protein